MKYPTPGEYQQALQVPAAAFTDPHLQDAVPETSALGLPRAITGAFAVVFPVATRGARFALKCFLTDANDQPRRYRAISEHLADRPLPYMAAFEYQRDGILVEDRAFPLLKMEWVDGMSLNRFVAAHLGELTPLIGAWRKMVADLEAAEISHGDLQHGNVLVDRGRLRLVDYDTMHVPALAGKRSAEVGHRNYQHPDRDERDFGPHLDRFSALVIDTAMQACVRRPELWEQFDTGENLLFRSEDFLDPRSSAVFEELRRIEELRPQVEALERACLIEPDRVPPLRAVVADARAVPATSKRARRRSQDEVLRDPFESAFLPAVLAAGAVVGAVGIAVGWSAAAAALAPALAAGALVVGNRYRKLPAARRRRRLRREDSYFRRLIGSLRDELEVMYRRRDQIERSREQRSAERLEELRESALHDRLKHHFVGEARGFEGLTHKVIVRLKAAGIRTASQATARSVNDVTRLRPETKARVHRWRSMLAARYQDEIPTSLSPAEERRLKRGLERQLSDIDRDIARLEAKIRVQESEHAKIRERLDAVDAPTVWQYAAFLLRLRQD